MKAIKSLFLLILVLISPAWADKPAYVRPDVGPAATLNATAHYVDSLFSGTLDSLELIANTPEARSGDWNGIKRYLERLEARQPGVYFYVLPNGNYYSVANDFTNLNLSDRGYFKSLMMGERVTGVPIYSRSSGKKSALMAVPILVDGKITGALAASVFLDEMHARLNREFALPAGHIWYVLDSAGTTMLHQDADFIFLNALTQGSPSLRDALSHALKCERGEMEYVLGSVRHVHYRKLPSMDWWMFLAKIGDEAEATPPQATLSLNRFVADMQASLDRIDASLAQLIEDRKGVLGEQGEIRRLLATYIAERPDVVDASFVDAQGVLRQIEPSEYRNLENADVSKREHVIATLNTRQPVFSSGFRAFEGFLAVELTRPMHDANGNFLGFIGAFMRPELLIDPLLKSSVIPDDHELWIMQTDGMIIFDQDRDEIGRMLFSDPLYAAYGNLLELGKKMAASPTGTGSYVFLAPGSQQPVIKHVAWQTISLHGREWRVVLAWRPYEK
jgi:hypothetical protein